MITLASLAAWVVLGQNGIPETPVTLSSGGGRVELALEQLSKQASVPLAATGVMKGEILALHAENVPLNKLLAKVAEVTEGAWELSGNTWTLVPNRAAREAARVAKRAERMKKLREELTKASKPPKPEEEKEEVKESGVAQAVEMAFMGGDYRLARLVAALDLSALVDLPAGGRVVFSSNPTRMQRSFTPNARIIQELIEEHNKMAQFEKQSTNTDVDEDSQRMAEWMKKMGLDRKSKPITEPPAKILIAVQNGGNFMAGALEASLKVYDRSGNVLLSSSMSLLGGFMAESFGGEIDEDGAPAKPAPKDDSPKLVLTDFAKEFSKLTRTMGQAFMGGAQTSVSSDLKRAVARPAEFEPLGYLVGDYLVQAAKHRKQVLVANLPDNMIEVSDNVQESTTVNQFIKRIETRDLLKITSDGTMWTMMPKDGEESRKSRTDRPSLQQLLLSADASGTLKLRSLAEYASRNPEFGLQSPLPMLGAMIVAPGLLRAGFEPNLWDMLALYGSLSQPQRDDLDRGGRIPFASMTPSQLSHANRIVYGADPSIMVGPDTSQDDPGGFMGMMMQGFTMGDNDSDYRQEPTEVAPTGLQSSGFLHATVKQDMVFQAPSNVSIFGMMGNAGAEELAMLSMFKDMSGSEAAGFFPEIKDLRLGTRKAIRLSLQLAPEAAVRGNLNDDNIPADGKTYSMDTLPADAKARIEKAKESLKKMNMPFMDPSIFNRRNVPPPSR